MFRGILADNRATKDQKKQHEKCPHMKSLEGGRGRSSSGTGPGCVGILRNIDFSGPPRAAPCPAPPPFFLGGFSDFLAGFVSLYLSCWSHGDFFLKFLCVCRRLLHSSSDRWLSPHGVFLCSGGALSTRHRAYVVRTPCCGTCCLLSLWAARAQHPVVPVGSAGPSS